MMCRVASVFSLWLITTPVYAANESMTITVVGEATIVRPADRMHLEVEVYCEGSDLRDAMRQIESRRTASRELLNKLGAIANSVSFDDARIVPGQVALPVPQATDSNQETLTPAPDLIPTQAAVGEASAADGLQSVVTQSDLSLNTTPPLVLVSALLKAEFSLANKSGDERLILIDELQKKVRAADVPGLVDVKRARESRGRSKELTPELPCLCGLGQLRFTFQSELSNDEHTSVMKRALADASQKAQQLADASNLTLGTLKRIMASDSGPYSAKLSVLVPTAVDQSTIDESKTSITRIVRITAEFNATSQPDLVASQASNTRNGR